MKQHMYTNLVQTLNKKKIVEKAVTRGTINKIQFFLTYVHLLLFLLVSYVFPFLLHIVLEILKDLKMLNFGKH